MAWEEKTVQQVSGGEIKGRLNIARSARNKRKQK